MSLSLLGFKMDNSNANQNLAIAFSLFNKAEANIQKSEPPTSKALRPVPKGKSAQLEQWQSLQQRRVRRVRIQRTMVVNIRGKNQNITMHSDCEVEYTDDEN